MNIIRSLLDMPSLVSMILLILFFAGLDIVVTVFTRKYLAGKNQDKTSNEIAGYIFSVVAGFYALLLSFVVFRRWINTTMYRKMLIQKLVMPNHFTGRYCIIRIQLRFPV